MIDQGNSNVLNFGMNQMYIPSGFMDAVPVSRKRSRDLCSFDPFVSSSPVGLFVDQMQFNTITNNDNDNDNQKGVFSFLGQDFSMQIYEQEREIDRFISQHTAKIRSEIEGARKRITTRLIEQGMKKLRTKEEEIMKIGRLNYALEQKIKSITIDNQLWQQMAETNEAAANVLRRRLEQILAEIQQQQQNQLHDGESCCGSNSNNNNNNKEEGRMLVKGNDEVEEYSRDNNGDRRCRKCGKEEMCVLLLPCRHLCVCTVCESSINVCPICKSTKNASLHLNMNLF